jgi:hypothetical protein
MLIFWQVPANYVSGSLPYDYCIQMRDATLAAMQRVLSSNVQEYHVGSRGLKRLSLSDLQNLLTFWMNAANDAALGAYSGIQSRRAVPCDV